MIEVGLNKRWKFIHRRASGTYVGQLDRIFSWDCSRAENEKGSFSLTLPPDEVADFRVDDVLEFWRSWDSGRTFALDGATCWFVRDAEFTWDSGKESLKLTGHDATGLLDRRIVAWFAVQTAADGQNYYSKKSEPSTTILWDVFHENFGAGVVGLTPGDVPPSAGGPTGGITLAATPADREYAFIAYGTQPQEGPVITQEFAWKNCLSVMQDVARASAVEGTRLIFDIVYDPTAPSLFTFKIWTNMRGTNRTNTPTPTIFSLENENVNKITLSRIYADEATWVHVGGSGQGTLRISQGVLADPLKRSRFYPVESFVENTKTADYSALNDSGKAELFKRRARYEFKSEARDVPWTVYGRDYQLGDLVLAKHRGVTATCRVSKARISLSNGVESISIPLESTDDLGGAI